MLPLCFLIIYKYSFTINQHKSAFPLKIMLCKVIQTMHNAIFSVNFFIAYENLAIVGLAEKLAKQHIITLLTLVDNYLKIWFLCA